MSKCTIILAGSWRLRRKLSGGKSACASRTEKVHRAEVQDVPLRRKKILQRSRGNTDGRNVQTAHCKDHSLESGKQRRKWVFRRYSAVVGRFSKCFWCSLSLFKQRTLHLRRLSGFLETTLPPKQTKKLLW